MKRCPQCDFIYLDTDEVCDLDGAKLILVADSELALNEIAKAKPAAPLFNSRPLLIAIVGCVLVGALLFGAYVFLAKARQQTQAQTPVQPIQQNLPTAVTVSVAPTPEPSPSPSAAPVVSPEPAQVEQPKRVALSKKPVSTSADNNASRQIWIKLSNGSRIEADEVWRTKEGVWYRRDGMVTLIKANRVKAIEKAK
jgi:hypothetical protein